MLATSDQPNDWHGRKWSRMCRATEFAKQTIVDAARYFVQNGYSVIHFDQECSGGYDASICWSDQHGHPPGHGRWIHLAMADLYERIVDACEPLDPDFMLSMEEPNELYLPWLNLCQSRPFGITSEWPVVPPATRSVPLFLYLYHENLIGWAAFYPWKSAGRPCYSVAKGFSIGQMPGLTPFDAFGRMTSENRERLLTLFTNCATAYRTFAHDYLVWGRMEKPLPLRIPVRELSMANAAPLHVPAVSHSVWSLDDGRVGVVLINPETQPFTSEINLRPILDARRDAGDSGVPTIREVRANTPARSHDSSQFTITIPPLDVVLIECDWRKP
ncbi:MAG: hypothetical protein D6741_20260 [Planctomycetota bacterium]|nr:MAG: hypothetical protein D6741_20260 [Planctomycetota bacterium]